MSSDRLILMNIYGPCTHEGKAQFLEWFSSVDIRDDMDWLVVGDFILIRYLENRKKPGEDINLILAFNEAISTMGLMELPLQG